MYLIKPLKIFLLRSQAIHHTVLINRMHFNLKELINFFKHQKNLHTINYPFIFILTQKNISPYFIFHYKNK